MEKAHLPTVESYLISLPHRPPTAPCPLPPPQGVHRHEDSAKAERNPRDKSVVPRYLDSGETSTGEGSQNQLPQLTLGLDLPFMSVGILSVWRTESGLAW